MCKYDINPHHFYVTNSIRSGRSSTTRAYTPRLHADTRRHYFHSSFRAMVYMTPLGAFSCTATAFTASERFSPWSLSCSNMFLTLVRVSAATATASLLIELTSTESMDSSSIALSCSCCPKSFLRARQSAAALSTQGPRTIVNSPRTPTPLPSYTHEPN